MCGIAGLLPPRPTDTGALAAVASAMGDRIRHRGPDEGDVWVDAAAGVGLSHRRLSIIDLSPAGHQPMHSASGRWVVAFNGEIYNFAELRQELERRGHAFRGHSDTEVLLAAVEEWGLAAALPRFNGMFAFALWDTKERRLFLARDRFGEKPLYYGWTEAGFLFASELKAFRAVPGFRPEVDRGVLNRFMQLAYVPEPECIFRGIQKLTPGAFAEVSPARPGACEVTPYWSMRDVVEAGLRDPFRGDEREAIEQLHALLLDAVRLRMYADVPLGAFLSGGIDSSTVVALMQAQASRPVKTFTIGFREDGFDEAQHAARVARHLGTDHSELYLSAEDALAVVPRLPELYDEPFADPSQIPTFLVSRLARQHVTVSLSGDAGDELFGGYTRYAVTRTIWSRAGWLPRSVRAAIGSGLRAAPGLAEAGFRIARPFLPASLRFANVRDKIQRFAGVVASESPEDVYRELICHWRPDARLVLGSDDAPAPIASLGAGGWDSRLIESMMFSDAVGYLPGDILAKVDRAAMGVSLESRVPLLDPRIADLAWRFPLELKLRDGVGKWIFRQVLHRHVPRELVERPKMGFGVPVGEWMRGPLRTWAQDLLAPDRIRRQGFLDPSILEAALEEHLSGRREHPYRLWNALMFQAWVDRAQAGA